MESKVWSLCKWWWNTLLDEKRVLILIEIKSDMKEIMINNNISTQEFVNNNLGKSVFFPHNNAVTGKGMIVGYSGHYVVVSMTSMDGWYLEEDDYDKEIILIHSPLNVSYLHLLPEECNIEQ